MARFEFLRQFPVLRNLVLIQFVTILCGLVLVMVAYRVASRQQATTVMIEQVQTALAQLGLTQEQIRAWNHLGLDTATRNALDSAKEKLHLSRIEIMDRDHLPDQIPSNGFVVPEEPDGTLATAIYAEVDPDLLSEKYTLAETAKYLLVGMVLLFFGIILISLNYVRRFIYRPIYGLNEAFNRVTPERPLNTDSIKAHGELRQVISHISQMHELSRDAVKAKAIVSAYRQVAHDIRSPLTVLSLLEGSLGELPEEKRVMLRSAIGRVKDITNSLHEKGREHKQQLESVLVSIVLQGIVSEKRLQYESRRGLRIQLGVFGEAATVFIRVNALTFKRVVSNIIDNAVEALELREGHIELQLSVKDAQVAIQCKDDGVGIPLPLQAQLGKQGFSYGKSGGSGLGLYHARQSLADWGGDLSFASVPGKGTTVTLLLPRAKAPEWFVKKLDSASHERVAVVDDDPAIHEVWKHRFSKSGSKNPIDLMHFNSYREVWNWHVSNPGKAERTLFLLDYELVGDHHTGLDIAADLGLSSNAVLVTSHFEDASVVRGCLDLGARLLPKAMADTIGL